MSKKKKIIIAVAILLCVAFSFIGGQSYSKYVAEVRGQGTADIAAWSFKVNGSKEQVETISLSSTHNDSEIINNKIAPGSDVGVIYTLSFKNETTKPTNLVFKLGGKQYNNLSQLLNQLGGTIGADAEEQNKIESFHIEWEWPFETGESPEEKARNNQIDTQEAQTLTNYSFDIIVAAEQLSFE